VFEIRKELVPIYKPRIIKVMETPPELFSHVRFKVDGHVWGK